MVMGGGRFGIGAGAAIVAGVLTVVVSPATAETLEQALVLSYQNNPQLNAQRAATRATDENVAIALGGYRPRVSATTSLSEVYLDNVSRTPNRPPGFARSSGEMGFRPETGRGRPKRRCSQRARRYGTLSRPSCSARRPPT
jgi:outer membrane protein TolC